MGEPDYPSTLQAIDSAPPLLAIRGEAKALARPMVAIVGSRNASAAGLTFTERLSRAVGEAGYTIVSGLARGIDTRAHRAAIATGTVAVLAGGLARVYPTDNQPLLEKILDEDGAAISEMPIEWEPRGRDFPRRNRIVSGLSLGVIVVEAARKSGSLITAVRARAGARGLRRPGLSPRPACGGHERPHPPGRDPVFVARARDRGPRAARRGERGAKAGRRGAGLSSLRRARHILG
jgi:DNA protecting protein DprA